MEPKSGEGYILGAELASWAQIWSQIEGRDKNLDPKWGEGHRLGADWWRRGGGDRLENLIMFKRSGYLIYANLIRVLLGIG